MIRSDWFWGPVHALCSRVMVYRKKNMNDKDEIKRYFQEITGGHFEDSHSVLACVRMKTGLGFFYAFCILWNEIWSKSFNLSSINKKNNNSSKLRKGSNILEQRNTH